MNDSIHKVLDTEQASTEGFWLPFSPHALATLCGTIMIWTYRISLLSKCFSRKRGGKVQWKTSLITSDVAGPGCLHEWPLRTWSMSVFCHLPRPLLCGCKGTQRLAVVRVCLVPRFSCNIESVLNLRACSPALSYQRVRGMQGPGITAANDRRHLPGLIAFVFNCMLMRRSARQ